MTSFKPFLMPVAVALFAAGSCMDSLKISENDTEIEGTIYTSQIVVETTEFQVSSAAQTLTVGYSVNNAVSGVSLSSTVEEGVTWLSATVGDNTVVLSVEADDSGEGRSATVTLSYAGAEDVTLTVTQSNTVINVDTSDITVDALGSTMSLFYSVEGAVEGESLSVSTSESWLNASVGNDVVTLSVDANTTKEERSATVTLSYTGASSVSFTVNQTVPVIIVSNSEVNALYAGGTVTFNFSVSNAVEGDVVTATGDGTVVTSASVNNSTVTLTVSETTESTTRRGTVTLSSTYAKDVEVSVVQETAYSAFLGTWTVTDSKGTSATITISQNVENESYTISGWQFSEEYSFSYMGFSGIDGTTSFTANYNSTNKTLEIPTYTFGTGTIGAGDYSGNSGTMYLIGKIYDEENDAYYLVPSDYTAATMTLTSAYNATLTGGTISVEVYTDDGYVYYTYDIVQLCYAFILDSGSALIWSSAEEGTYLPSAASKVSLSTASTSSVHSANKPVPVKNDIKVMK